MSGEKTNDGALVSGEKTNDGALVEFHDAIVNIRIVLRQLRETQKRITRENFNGRHLSIAITDLESAENWLLRSN